MTKAHYRRRNGFCVDSPTK